VGCICGGGLRSFTRLIARVPALFDSLGELVAFTLGSPYALVLNGFFGACLCAPLTFLLAIRRFSPQRSLKCAAMAALLAALACYGIDSLSDRATIVASERRPELVALTSMGTSLWSLIAAPVLVTLVTLRLARSL
jgi:hypothetical protein